MLILCVVLFLLQPTTGAEVGQFSALKFASDVNSYIIFKPDMTPFRTGLSVCAWVRKLRTSGVPTWFSYATSVTNYEIEITDQGSRNNMFSATDHSSTDIDVTSRFTVSPGTWFHCCATWSTTTQVHKLYLNGALVGSRGTPTGRTLGMDGYVVIGNEQQSYGGGMDTVNMFGGELYQLNMYSKEFTASEVHDMAAGGRCSGIERQYPNTRHLKWETILQLGRNGDVKDIKSGCEPPPTELELLLQTRLDEMENELNKTKSDLEETREDLKGTKDRLNETEHQLEDSTRQGENATRQLNDTQTELHDTRSDLQESAHRLNQTTRQLKEATQQGENATQQLENATRQLENATRQLENATECPQQVTHSHWDVMYSGPFLNKVVTRDLFMQLRSSWDMLEDFVGSGVRLTEDVIEHFKSYQELRLSVSEGCDTREDGM